MIYEAELRLLCDTFQKCHVNTAIVDLHAPLEDQLEAMELPSYLSGSFGSLAPFTGAPAQVLPATIYKVTDQFSCQYLYFLLPALPRETLLVIGPYFTEPPTQQKILEWAEKHGITAIQQKRLTHYYSSVPALSVSSHLYMLVEAFADRLWGRNNFSVEDVHRNFGGAISPLSVKKSSSEEEDVLWNMKTMEQRYAYENALIDAVSKGQVHKADAIFSNFSPSVFEQRISNPLRNAKNYCIIMNTLLRKAAEKGGVHPLYLDSTSSAYAIKLEQLTALEAVLPLMKEMFCAYCRLVRSHCMKTYSPTVQKAIACIDSDLTGNLSLRALAQALNVSGSYLSTVFKKETGQTLTEYINRQRIRQAKYLLETTRLQIQTIAQHCGIVDVHYFSKVFKRITGMTPKEYRASVGR